jgi:hypothetical protein
MTASEIPDERRHKTETIDSLLSRRAMLKKGCSFREEEK